MNGAIEWLDEYACRAGTLRRGDRFTVAGGPYYKTADGARTALAERGQMTFIRFCRRPCGESVQEWIEAWAAGAGFTVLYVGRTYDSPNVPGLVRRPYKIKRVFPNPNSRGDDDVATKSKTKSKKQPAAKRTSKKGPAPETKEPAAPVAPTKKSKATWDDAALDRGRKPKAKAESEGTSKKLSALDAAAQVLAAAGAPMNTKAMIEEMAAKGLWTSPGGKTPSATLYSAILREITVKGDASRFEKSDRGTFTIKR